MIAWWALLGLTLKLDAGALIIGLLPTLAVLVNYWLVHRQGRKLTAKVDEVHVLVNSQMTTALNRIVELEKKLGLAPGDPVPTLPVVTKETTP